MGASVEGAAHIKAGIPCQDSSRIIELSEPDGVPLLVLAAADGAGSASQAAVGSQVACDALLAAVKQYFDAEGWIHRLSEDRVADWVANLRAKLDIQATVTGLAPRDFACTLLAALVGATHSAFLQIGDGAIVVGDGDGYTPVFWPQTGEYANTTYFLTDDDPFKALRFEVRSPAVDEIAVFTDGLQTLALSYAAATAHVPFFRPLFARLRRESPGESTDLAPQLIEFLASSRVNERTEDDKTLVLATRRSADET